MIGTIVKYQITESDSDRIRLSDAENNSHVAGQEFPMIIVRDWNNGTYNGKVFIDGEDNFLWVTSVKEGDVPGTFSELDR